MLAAAISSHILASAYGDEANPLEFTVRLSSSLAAILDKLPANLGPAARGSLAEPTSEGAAAPQLDLRERPNDRSVEGRALYGLEAGSSAEAPPDGKAAPADPLTPDPEATEPIAPNPSASGPLESDPEAIEPIAPNPSA
ncbi:MAG: hypothetical protein JW986_06210, partial [Methanotrichaceae archaeon]|nr:hypothetical protein [Methanotrichaceae archaeon]